MKNTAKEQAIIKAYGEYWEQVKDYVDEDGWCSNYYHLQLLNIITCDFKEMHIVYGNPETWVRPKSIQGIENNNGWIRIDSEEDLPKESGLYFILDEDDNIIHSEFDINFGQFFAKDFTYDHYELTHYQPIVKPETPIY